MTLKPARLQWSDDGTLRSLDFADVYFQAGQGQDESHYVFLEQNNLPKRFLSTATDSFRIAELGFGSGLNFLLTARLWSNAAPSSAQLTYTSIEKHPIPLATLKKIFQSWPELQEWTGPLLSQYPPMIEGFHHLHFFGGRIRLVLLFGDVAKMLPELKGDFDAWYLDGFAPVKNPEMWKDRLFPLIAARTKPGGTLATFSSVGRVRRQLQTAGFIVNKVKGFGTKWAMTVARMEAPPSPQQRKIKNIAVLGAGIAGASAAFALAQKGYDVTVIDRQPAAAEETSGNPVGIVYPKMTVDASPLGQFHQHGFSFTCSLVTALNLPSWSPCGVTHLDTFPEKEKRHRALGEQNYPDDYLKYDNGLHQPSAGHLSPPEFCRALLNHPKIKTVYSQTISALEELKQYDAIIIALGHSSKGFKETAWLPLQSLRGQVTYLTPTPASGKITNVFCHEGFITPAVNGLHYAGATFQREEPAPPNVRHADHLENLQKLNLYLPELGLSEKNISGGRAGYRTTTMDKLPMIGVAPNYDFFTSGNHEFHKKIYISTAFGAHGMTDAPLAGEIIASLISGDPLPIPASLLAYLAPERFILRDLKRRKV